MSSKTVSAQWTLLQPLMLKQKGCLFLRIVSDVSPLMVTLNKAKIVITPFIIEIGPEWPLNYSSDARCAG